MNKINHLIWKGFFTLIGLATLLVLAACSSGENVPTLSPTEGAKLLAGTYKTTISAEDISQFQSLDPNIAGNQGEWVIALANDGKFTAQRDGQYTADGTFTVDGGRIEFYVKHVCDNCTCQEDIGRYYWALKDDQFTFTKIAGGCDTMTLVLTTHPLARQP